MRSQVSIAMSGLTWMPKSRASILLSTPIATGNILCCPHPRSSTRPRIYGTRSKRTLPASLPCGLSAFHTTLALQCRRLRGDVLDHVIGPAQGGEIDGRKVEYRSLRPRFHGLARILARVNAADHARAYQLLLCHVTSIERSAHYERPAVFDALDHAVMPVPTANACA